MIESEFARILRIVKSVDPNAHIGSGIATVDGNMHFTIYPYNVAVEIETGLSDREVARCVRSMVDAAKGIN